MGGRSPREDGERTRRALVDAAVAQLATEGMRGLTHRRVEQRAGAAQGSTKYHFGSIDGLAEAVLAHIVEIELGHVMTMTPEVRAEAGGATSFSTVPAEVWESACRAAEAVFSRPDLVRARYELYLYAADRPAMQEIVRAARERFIQRVGAELTSPDPRTGARMVLALVDGLLLQQISAPEADAEEVAAMLMVVAAGASAFLPPPGSARAGRRR